MHSKVLPVLMNFLTLIMYTASLEKVSEWKAIRRKLIKWISLNQGSIERIVQLLAVQTDPEIANNTHKLVHWVIKHLVNEIDQQVEDHPFEVDDLSQALAESGLLPMFGFPNADPSVVS